VLHYLGKPVSIVEGADNVSQVEGLVHVQVEEKLETESMRLSATLAGYCSAFASV
jgi:hypothetical protein